MCRVSVVFSPVSVIVSRGIFDIFDSVCSQQQVATKTENRSALTEAHRHEKRSSAQLLCINEQDIFYVFSVAHGTQQMCCEELKSALTRFTSHCEVSIGACSPPTRLHFHQWSLA